MANQGARTPLFVRHQPGGLFSIVDVINHPGQIFFVHSGTGTDSSGYGQNPDSPLATLDYAIGLCDANKSDTIYLMPGHNEGIGNAQITVDVAGISIIGLGKGSARPRFDFDHANASIDVTANGVTIENIVLLPSVTAVLVGIDVNAGVTDTVIRGVETLPGEDGAGVDEFAKTIDIKAGCTRTLVENCVFTQHASAAGVISCVALTGASDLVTIRGCKAWTAGGGLVAPINGDTTLSTRVHIANNLLVTDAEPGIELLTGTTGFIEGNRIFGDLANIADAIVADACGMFGNYYTEVAPETGALIGTASVND